MSPPPTILSPFPIPLFSIITPLMFFFFLFLFLLPPPLQSLCLWESSTPAVAYADWTRQVAEEGCTLQGCAPLGSWEDDPFRDSGVYACGAVNASCGGAGNATMATSLRAAYGKPLLRSYERVGLHSDVGWWSGSTRTGEYIQGAYINSSDGWLFGAGNIETDYNGVLRKWFCLCL